MVIFESGRTDDDTEPINPVDWFVELAAAADPIEQALEPILDVLTDGSHSIEIYVSGLRVNPRIKMTLGQWKRFVRALQNVRD
jgi:hypothetical protein